MIYLALAIHCLIGFILALLMRIYWGPAHVMTWISCILGWPLWIVGSLFSAIAIVIAERKKNARR